MRDLQERFAACFQPPSNAEGTRITFYFSLDSNGDIVGGKPRTVAFGFNGSEDKRSRLDIQAEDALTKCWPAFAIVGKVLPFEGPVGARRLVEHRDVWLDPALMNKPAQHLG
ncbi:MAG TPA: hypothetical protein VHR44_03005 [Beijerinckiaceae bacterium]|nr:hypothetical protein [Beijerinckiaceae bacterium]